MLFGSALAADKTLLFLQCRKRLALRRLLDHDCRLLPRLLPRSQALDAVAGRYSPLLHADGGSREARELQAECSEDVAAVEARLAGIYIQSRTELLNDVLEEYFEDDGTVWAEAPLPTGPRDCAFEIVNALVRCPCPSDAVPGRLYGLVRAAAQCERLESRHS